MDLKPHPQNLTTAPNAKLKADLSVNNSRMTARFEFTSDEELFVPPSTRARKNELWKSTCFELFLKPRQSPNYWEINFCPTGDWNVYFFESYRSGMRDELKIKEVKLEQLEYSEKKCVCEFSFDLAPIELSGHVQVGVTAVIEMKSGSKSYWALEHSADQPNFHLADSFVHSLSI
jgi:hypothetical protein